MKQDIKDVKQRILIESDGEKLLAKYLNEITNQFFIRGLKDSYAIVSNFETILLEKIAERVEKGKITQFEISRIIEGNGSPADVANQYIEINEIELDSRYDTKTGLQEGSSNIEQLDDISQLSEKLDIEITDGIFSSIFDSLIQIVFGSGVIFVEIWASPVRISGRVLDGFYLGIQSGLNQGTNPIAKILKGIGGAVVGPLKGFVNGFEFTFNKMGEGFEIIGKGFVDFGKSLYKSR